MSQKPNDLWTITSYFNPIGFKSRSVNYQVFRKTLNSPLLTVELSYSTRFELRAKDADRLIQLRTDQVLWQKERLLNLAIAQLPAECRFVAWLDCDVVFKCEERAELARKAFQEFVMIQPYVKVHDLDHNEQPTVVHREQIILTRESMASKYVAQTIDFNQISTNSLDQYSPGHAWVIHRDALEGIGLYDGMILGSGDLGIAMAAIGRFDDIVLTYEMNPAQAKHYLAWAGRFYEIVNGSVGVIEGEIYHLWHGELEDRGYSLRYSRLKRFDFDPFKDITIDEKGFWRWNSNKTDLHEYVMSYFQSRNEDGRRDR